MFDYIKCEVMLPDGTLTKDREFQTKSLDNLLATYVISAKGELYKEDWDYVWVDDDDRFLKGYMKMVDGSYRREYLTDYHGDIIFYSGINEDGVWRNYFARFTNGKLSRMWYEDENNEY